MENFPTGIEMVNQMGVWIYSKIRTHEIGMMSNNTAFFAGNGF